MTETKEDYFTKDDYLSPTKAAIKFKESRKLVQDLMTEIYRKKMTFNIGSKKRILVILKHSAKANLRNMANLRLHPLGIEIFQELLTQAKDKSK